VAGLAVVALIVLAPLAASGLSAYASDRPSPSGARASANFADVSVTWDGSSISHAGSPASALSISKGQTATVVFTFVQSIGGPIRNATLQLTYLGVVLTTSRAAAQPIVGPPGAYGAGINWSFGPLYDALEGVFEFTAGLVYANGSTAWTQTFFVFAKAPYLLESGAVVVLIILAIAELYWGVAAIRQARKGAKPSATPPASGSTAAPDSGSGTGSTTAAASGPGSPAESPPPPAGGGGTP
jgi:hypothetical protein